jgi:malate dehydrogenase
MREVAVMGAGELGGALAHALAKGGVVDRVRLIDPRRPVAEGMALDIKQAAPIEGFSTEIAGSADPFDAAAASVVVLADSARDGARGDEELLRQVCAAAPGAVVICALASHRSLVERGVGFLRCSPHRLFGTAPQALAGAVRALLALHTGNSPRDVALTVLGAPPERTVIPWEDATIAGVAVTRLLDRTTMREIAARVPALWPPGPYALASAAAAAVAAVVNGPSRLLSCFVRAPTSGAHGTAAVALPVRVGPGGILAIEVPLLDGQARVALENAMLR